MKARILVLITLLVIAGSVERVEAQGKGRSKQVRATRAYHPVVVRRAHIRYTHLPRWGTVVTTVPSSAIMIRAHKKPYYFSNGIYYVSQNSSYVIVRPSRGLKIRALPAGYRTVVVGPRNYYYYYGTYYMRTGNNVEYQVVDPPLGAVVDSLPDGYDVRMLNGIEYYMLDGIYYAEVDMPEFEDGIGYEVVRP
jgi:Family of unknown function (DUF6515)